MPRVQVRVVFGRGAHVVPQVPQLFRSVCAFTQVDPHCVCPIGHTQTPAVHVAVAGQTLPHAPQFDGSVCRSTQLLPHCDCPLGHVHMPPEQLRDASGQTLPHAPQFDESIATFVHRAADPVPQTTSPGVEHAQIPLTHVVPARHVCPQAPQFAGSVCVFTHADVVLEAQSVCPAIEH